MKLGVISDSHVQVISDLPKKAKELLEGMDLIIHAGDYVGKELIYDLRELGNFKGVYGNMDPLGVREEIPEKEILELNNLKVAITHPSDGGSPFGLEKRIKKKFKQVDAIIFGHTHLPKNEIIDGVLYFNPGSITGKFPARHKTFGILEIEKEIKVKIVKL